MKGLSKFFVFCFVGGLSFLIDLSFVNLFFFWSIPFHIARTLSVVIALLFNFFVNRRFTFKATNKRASRQIIPFIIVYTIANIANLLSSILIVQLVGENVININVASFIGSAISIPLSFTCSNLWTFGKKQR